MGWAAFGASDVGLVRARNEDAFSVDGEVGCYLVADGLGVNRNLLTRWKAQYAASGVVSSTPVDEKQRDLDAENRRLPGRIFTLGR